MTKSMKRISVKAIAATLALAIFTASSPALADAGNLYYRMGGGSPGGRASYDSQIAEQLGIGAALRLNYSCGKFDLGFTWRAMIEELKNLGSKLESALWAGIASLPLYILMRAQPGLYQLFKTYSQEADLLIAAALKTCEEMEAQILAGQNPYEDWMKLAKGEGWKIEARHNGDIIYAKDKMERSEKGQREGVPWVFGKKAGGVNSDPIQPIKDISIAGYNITLGKAVNADPKGSNTGKDSRLTRTFPTAESLVTFTTEVLGDKRIYTCSQGDADCPDPTTTVTATGLGPKVEAEYKDVQPVLAELASGAERGTTAQEKLEGIGTEGFTVNGTLLETLRRLPEEERNVAVERLSRELAMHRTINKALVARSVLLTGMSLPEVTKAGGAMRTTQEQIDRLTKHIDDLTYESRVRRELTSNTALAIMSEQASREATAAAVPSAVQADPNPLDSGGFVPNK